MADKYDKWINDSQRWQKSLQEKLDQHDGTDLVSMYSDVAFAFPSRDPHPYSFDLPKIDDVALLKWAKSKGWKVQLAHELTAEKKREIRQFDS